jgi:hypothetical protein
MNTPTIGKYAFLIGLGLAVLAGLLYQPAWAIWVLAILGVIVGLLNITAEDTRGFLLAAIALTLSATALNTIPIVGTAFSYVLPFVVAFVAGATIVVALKELFQTARS